MDAPLLGSERKTEGDDSASEGQTSRKTRTQQQNAQHSPVRLLVCAVPPFSPVSEPLLEWKVVLLILDPDAAPCRRTHQRSAKKNSIPQRQGEQLKAVFKLEW